MSKIYTVNAAWPSCSHEDVLRIFSTREKAEEALIKYKTEYPDPDLAEGVFYLDEVDVSEFESWDADKDTKWVVVSQIPSVGKNSIVPYSCIGFELFELDKDEEPLWLSPKTEEVNA